MDFHARREVIEDGRQNWLRADVAFLLLQLVAEEREKAIFPAQENYFYGFIESSVRLIGHQAC